MESDNRFLLRVICAVATVLLCMRCSQPDFDAGKQLMAGGADGGTDGGQAGTGGGGGAGMGCIGSAVGGAGGSGAGGCSQRSGPMEVTVTMRGVMVGLPWGSLGGDAISGCFDYPLTTDCKDRRCHWSPNSYPVWGAGEIVVSGGGVDGGICVGFSQSCSGYYDPAGGAGSSSFGVSSPGFTAPGRVLTAVAPRYTTGLSLTTPGAMTLDCTDGGCPASDAGVTLRWHGLDSGFVQVTFGRPTSCGFECSEAIFCEFPAALGVGLVPTPTGYTPATRFGVRSVERARATDAFTFTVLGADLAWP